MDLPKARTIRKFNPGTFQSDEEVIRQFVVRERELELVLDVLRGNVDAPSCQHVLLVAPRGRGKTMLLARIAAELRTGNDLSQWLLPVRFMEESLEVFDIADFWLETVFYLSKEIVGCDPDLARELHAVHEDLATHWRGEFLADRARAAVLDASIQLGRKFVLMVENLQTLCNDVDDDFGWQLRETLQTEPQIMLVGTATSRFKGLEEAQAPFFELFRTIHLYPLDTEACRRLWKVVSGDEVSKRGIRPLQILTGGSPRLLVIVAEFSWHRSLRQLMEELVLLIDDHTEYFRGHLDALAPSERRVYLAVIDLWQPSSTSEIASRARMDVRIVSSLLGRLVDRGVVVVHGKGRKRDYSAVERLYSIYYKMRRVRDEATIVHYLIRFMAVFYSEKELVKMTNTFRMEAAQSAYIEEGLKRARAELPKFDHILARTASSTTAFETTIEKTSKSSRSVQTQRLQLMSVSALMAEGNTTFLSGEHDAAISIFNSIVERFGNSKVPDIQLLVAIAMGSIGYLHDINERYDTAIESYGKFIERFGDSTEPRVRICVATTLVNMSISQSHKDEFKAAIVTSESVVKQYETDVGPHIRQVIARALLNKGMFKGKLGESVEEIESYSEVICRFGSDAADAVQAIVAKAMVNKGVVQGQLGNVEAAIVTYDSIIDRYRNCSTSEMLAVVVRAILNLGNTHGQQGDYHESIATFERIVEEYDQADSKEVQTDIVRTMVAKAFSHTELGHSDDALLTCDEVERRLRYFEEGEMVKEKSLAEWIKVKALLIHSDENAAMALFSTIYHDSDPRNEDSLSMLQSGVVNMILLGVSERKVLDVLLSDERKAEALSPLTVALRKRLGEKVRAPVEVIEVADDVIRKLEKETEKKGLGTSR